ncbi:MAG: Galactose-phosphate uridylyltransferase [Chloroflexota bacterium]
MNHAPGTWEERWHPLREEWVVIAAHRQNRPWIGQTVSATLPSIPHYDETCYLCPGNARVGGVQNPDYGGVYVFENDHPCVGPLSPEPIEPGNPYRTRRADGIARVVCFSPAHNLTIAEMPTLQIQNVVAAWQQQTRDLGSLPQVQNILCFENKGSVVGVSNPHPHGQVYATNFVFKTIETALLAMQRYARSEGRGLMDAIVAEEQRDGRRILYEDTHTIAFVPYFARYAYEVYIVPKRRVAHLHALSDQEAASLAAAIKAVTVRFDNLWQLSFPYVMPIHQAPTDDGDYRDFHAYITFHPPLRQPALLKYLAGPEVGGGNFLNDTSPEASALALRSVSEKHYLLQGAVQ